MKKISIAARRTLIAIACAVASAAFAAPITVSAGETVIWNVDLTGTLAGAPPFDTVYFNTHFVPTTALVTWSFFGDLDAQGTAFLSWGSGLDTVWGGFQEIVDGVFSARLVVMEGSMQLDPTAYGELHGVQGRELSLSPRASGLPEPATVVLSGMGLLAAAAARRNRRR